jgi:hypothetical protein
MTPRLLATLLREAGPERFLLHNTFHFLKYRCRTGVNGGDVQARTDPAIAELVVGVAEIEPTFVQFLLQQTAAHAFVIAAARLLEEHGANIDEPSEYDDRTPREIGRSSLYDNPDQSQELEIVQGELEEERRQHQEQLSEQRQHQEQLSALFEQKEKEKLIQLEEDRIALFRKTMIGAGGLVPFSLGARELQAWLMNAIGESKALHDLVALMGAIDGMTILSSWTEVGHSLKKENNFGKINKDRAALSLGLDADELKKIKMVAWHKLTRALNGDIGATKENAPLAYYKAILVSCEKRSLLTDMKLVKVIGEGGFGGCGLCEFNDAQERCGLALHPSPIARLRITSR